MHDVIWFAIVPTLMLLAGIVGLSFWPQHGAHQGDPAADTRSPGQRWEDGPAPARRPRPDIGSMTLDDEAAWRYRARCDDTGEHASTVMLPRLGNAIGYDEDGTAWIQAPGGPVPAYCPRCEAPDDRPHYGGCPFYDPDEAALFAVQLTGLEPVTVRARNLDPAAWRPYLTESEFAESFPGVPYDEGQADDGPHTGDLAAPVTAELADQLDQLDRETADWLAQRAAAHADTRARMILAWQALRQHSA
jgi:hypothetical protein